METELPPGNTLFLGVASSLNNSDAGNVFLYGHTDSIDSVPEGFVEQRMNTEAEFLLAFFLDELSETKQVKTFAILSKIELSNNSY